MILILHGWGQDKSTWESVTQKLSKVDKTLAIDLPGFGQEPLVSPDWGIPEYANWIIDYIKTNKLNDVVLIGHSFGGRITSFIASDNPEWLKAVVLVASPSIYRPSNSTKNKVKLYKLSKRLIPNKLKQKFYSDELSTADAKSLGNIFRKVVTFDQTDLLPKIRKPSLLIWGENDNDVPVKIATEMKELIPGSSLIVIPNTGHQLHLENSTLFYGYVKNFIQNFK